MFHSWLAGWLAGWKFGEHTRFSPSIFSRLRFSCNEGRCSRINPKVTHFVTNSWPLPPDKYAWLIFRHKGSGATFSLVQRINPVERQISLSSLIDRESFLPLFLILLSVQIIVGGGVKNSSQSWITRDKNICNNHAPPLHQSRKHHSKIGKFVD